MGHRVRRRLSSGTLNFSILDGWWAEAYDGSNGFAIGIGGTHAIPSIQDERDHKALTETLTNEVVPLYYDRDQFGLPREWIARQKNGLRTLAWRFNADRMVMDYVQHRYLPAVGGVSCSMPDEQLTACCREVLGKLSNMSQAQSLVGEKLGSFRIESVVGSGAMGVVYRAHEREDRAGRGGESGEHRVCPGGKDPRPFRARSGDPAAVPPPEHRPISGGRPVSGNVVSGDGVRRRR